ncbi:MAG: MtnX-like HAD-IB family phosphatase [Candidatus Heimdallarchaeota archaeon]|nr:MtnX-like HAD-IB family phosphatase [Candidatus Heimdallarchaeota archaeon]
MPIAICCDFDGTVTLSDTGKELLSKLTTADWQAIDKFVIDGQIGTREALIKQWGMIEHTTWEEIFNIVDTIQIDPTFYSFHNWITQHNLKFLILSDGFETYIHRILRNHKIDSASLNILANDVELINNKLKLKFNTQVCNHNCANCKYSVVQQLQREGYSIIYIGDGLSDILPAAELADVIYARRNEDLAKKLQGDSRLKIFDNFKEIKEDIERNLL